MQEKEPACLEPELCLRRHDSSRGEHYQAVTIGSTFSDVDLNFSCIFSIVGSVYNFVYFTIRRDGRNGISTTGTVERKTQLILHLVIWSSHFGSN
jgi:hypothetical protein